MMNVVFGTPGWLGQRVRTLVKIAGLAVSILLLVLRERTMAYWYNFTRRAVELEKALGFRQYSTRPTLGVVTGRNAMWVFFVLVILFWASLGFWPPM